MGTGEGNGRGFYSVLEAKTSPIWVHEFVWFCEGGWYGAGAVAMDPTRRGKKCGSCLLY
jgi:hypothetical protein